jgi:catechol 2,3-dioxygenase-like lactoylglutathione lyase family enzyme
MLGHVSIRVLDLEASVEFYLHLLAPLSFEAMRFPGVIGLGPSIKTSSAPIPCLWLRQHTPAVQNNHSDKPTPVHISFYTTERKKVNEFHECGLKAGGQDNGTPGLRPFMDNYYGISVHPFLRISKARSADYGHK